MSNAKDEQRAYWNGAGGERWTLHQESLDCMVRPFALADRNLIVKLLSEAGFQAIDVLPFDCEVELSNSGLDQAVRFALTASRAAHLLANASDSERARAAVSVKAALSASLIGERVVLGGAAWTVLAQAE